ncbi:MAG: hypothetical protein ACI8UD_001564, partial [Planctomycetota bacterium]
MHAVFRRRGLLATIVTVIAFTTSLAQQQDPQPPAAIDYQKEIEPLFA